MAVATITKRSVDAAKSGHKDSFLWDDDIPGFGLKITPKGGRVFIFQYRIAAPGTAERTTPRRYTIGKYGKLTPDQARKETRRLAALVERGIDPRESELDRAAEKVEAAKRAIEKARLEGDLAFENVAARWLDHYENEKGRRPRTVEQARHVIAAHLEPALKGKPLPHITRVDLQPIIDAIPIKHRASRLAVYAYASVMFRWAMERGEITDNPVRLMSKPSAPEARKRVLVNDELATIWKASGELPAPLDAFYRVLLLAGQRREEVAGMFWGELDRASATWIIPADRAKNGVEHIVPLAPALIVELDRLALAAQTKANASKPDAKRWPKTGPVMSIKGNVPLSCSSRAKRMLDAEIAKLRKDDGPMLPWRVHDLRRTMATGFQRLGVRFEVTEATLNHVSGAKGGVAGIYQRHDWREEKQSALKAWERHVAEIVAPASQDNVVSLDTTKRWA